MRLKILQKENLRAAGSSVSKVLQMSSNIGQLLDPTCNCLFYFIMFIMWNVLIFNSYWMLLGWHCFDQMIYLSVITSPLLKCLYVKILTWIGITVGIQGLGCWGVLFKKVGRVETSCWEKLWRFLLSYCCRNTIFPYGSVRWRNFKVIQSGRWRNFKVI